MGYALSVTASTMQAVQGSLRALPRIRIWRYQIMLPLVATVDEVREARLSLKVQA